MNGWMIESENEIECISTRFDYLLRKIVFTSTISSKHTNEKSAWAFANHSNEFRIHQIYRTKFFWNFIPVWSVYYIPIYIHSFTFKPQFWFVYLFSLPLGVCYSMFVPFNFFYYTYLERERENERQNKKH